MDTGIKVSADPLVVAATLDAIMKILECHYADNDTKRLALDVLGKSAGVSGTIITGCTFTG